MTVSVSRVCLTLTSAGGLVFISASQLGAGRGPSHRPLPTWLCARLPAPATPELGHFVALKPLGFPLSPKPATVWPGPHHWG